MQSIDTLPAAPSDVPGSISTTTSPPPDSFFDPFTGVPLGILSAKNDNSSSEDLWAHLTRIRSLQADVARLHLTMESIGLGDAVTPRLPSSAPRAVGERLEDDDDEIGDADGGVGGSEAENRREREFERSERGFDRRKEDIGQIMSKVRASLAPFFFLPVNSVRANVGTACSWTRSRRHSRRFMRSTRQCSTRL
jgi:hypothetical protein